MQWLERLADHRRIGDVKVEAMVDVLDEGVPKVNFVMFILFPSVK